MELHSSFCALLLQEGGRSAEEWLQLGTLIVTRVAETIGAVVIAIGVMRALALWIVQNLPGRRQDMPTESIRLGLGRSLGLALEFLLAADILSTAIAPSWDEIGKLAAIATIRTLLNYFLGKELEHEERRRGSEPASSLQSEDGVTESRRSTRQAESPTKPG